MKIKNKEYIIFGSILFVLVAVVFITYRMQENAKNAPGPIRGDFTNVFEGFKPEEVPLAGDNFDNTDYSNIG